MKDRNYAGSIFSILSVILLAPALVLAQESVREQPISPPQTGEVINVPVPQIQPAQPMQPKSTDKLEGANNENQQEEYVNPREIGDVLRQISQQKSEVKRLLKAAQKQKMSDATTELQSISSQIAQHEQAIRGEGNKLTRDTLQEFYDTQIWESIEKIRYQAQLPQELKRIETELKRVDSLLKQKTIVAIPNLNLEAVRAKVAESRAAFEQAKSALASGDNDALRDAMETFWQDGGHPGEIMGTLTQLRDISNSLKRIKSADVRDAFFEILSPVFESINNGDFREARMLLESLRQELMPLIGKAEQSKNIDSNMQQKIQQLEQKLENRSESNQSGKQKISGPQSYVPYWYNQRASVLDSILSWFGF